MAWDTLYLEGTKCSPVTLTRNHGPIFALIRSIKLTRRAYLSATEPPDAKSFVRNILSISSLKPKILARSRM